MKRYPTVSKGAVVCAAFLIVAIQARSDSDSSSDSDQWRLANHDLSGTRSQPNEERISPANVSSLAPKWVFTTGGDVSATPAVAGNAIYFPDWAGNLFAVDKNTGQMIWSHKISEYDNTPGSFSRVTPAVNGNDLILGDILSGTAAHAGANIMAVDTQTGKLHWITKVDSHAAAIITGSPVVYNDVVFVGVSSNEEGLATDPNYPCCTFRGSMVALNARTGQMLWKTFDMPDNNGQTGGYSGGAIWQPPAIDAARGLLYVGTGNNYSVPQSVEDCQANAIATNNLTAVCAPPEDHFDSTLALDIHTGQIRWFKRLQGYDVWTVVCIRPRPGVSCPSPAGPDYDLGGAGPNLIGNIVGIGQKSGIYWALNADTGQIVWSTLVGPGGVTGGIEWGTATDGQRIYVAITNSSHQTYTLAPNGPTINWGSWAALDVRNGNIIWQTADPTPGATDSGAVSVANGVVYAGSFSGGMYGIDAKTGHILFSFMSGGSVEDGPSIADGVVYWGSGYKRIPPGTPNNKVFAFSLPKQNGRD